VPYNSKNNGKVITVLAGYYAASINQTAMTYQGLTLEPNPGSGITNNFTLNITVYGTM